MGEGRLGSTGTAAGICRFDRTRMDDAIRDLYGEDRVYSFWTYWRERYEKDHGLRLDHLVLSKALPGRLIECGPSRRAS